MKRIATRPPRSLRIACAVLLGMSLLAMLPALAQAQYENDPPAMSTGGVARAGVELRLVAGPTGAPGGFTIWWMKKSDFEANGSQWFPGGATFQMEACYTGAPTLHTMDGTLTSFVLAPGQIIETEIGDLFDETGIVTNSPVELEPGVDYVFCAYVNAGGGLPQSDYSATIAASTNPHGVCVFTIGYWKNHPGDWPTTSLTLGTVSYSQAQLLAILGTPAGGNGLLILAHQLIATKLNILNGGDPAVVSATVAAADALIGGLVVPPVGSGYLPPASVSALTQVLDDYNNGLLATEHCVTATQPTTWGRIKSLYR
jgi:hypothetical protein